MSDKITYLLGAGFSAPLGLPVMNNFLVKSKDMYINNSTNYGYFNKVFKTIRDLSIIKNYYKSDLFNIEEILSILEMGKRLQGSKLTKSFLKYISDVIGYYTPELLPPDPWHAYWYDELFGRNSKWSSYGLFFSSLFNLKFENKHDNTPIPYFSVNTSTTANYSVVTLNYDLILEKICDYLNGNIKKETAIEFRLNSSDKVNYNVNEVVLTKLHGSIDSKDIVAPTWSKDVSGNILTAWKLAYESIANSNHLRILGYSLPSSDAYIQYLLKSAIIKSHHLKRIDVICLDKDGSVKQRYDEFIDFKYYQFVNEDVINYLDENVKLIMGQNPNPNKKYYANKIEETHRTFMESHG